jgi:hypothetical protein
MKKIILMIGLSMILFSCQKEEQKQLNIVGKYSLTSSIGYTNDSCRIVSLGNNRYETQFYENNKLAGVKYDFSLVKDQINSISYIFQNDSVYIYNAVGSHVESNGNIYIYYNDKNMDGNSYLRQDYYVKK